MPSRADACLVLCRFVAATWVGVVHIIKPGKYTFYSKSSQGSHIYVDGFLVVDNGGAHGVQTEEGSAKLGAGMHAFKADWFANDADAGSITVWYSGPDTGMQRMLLQGYSEVRAPAIVGAPGAPGAPGSAGADGEDGVNGRNGRNGSRGADGEDGGKVREGGKGRNQNNKNNDNGSGNSVNNKNVNNDNNVKNNNANNGGKHGGGGKGDVSTSGAEGHNMENSGAVFNGAVSGGAGQEHAGAGNGAAGTPGSRGPPPALPRSASLPIREGESETEDPFGFRRKERMQKEQQDRNMANFAAFIANQHATAPSAPQQASRAASAVISRARQAAASAHAVTGMGAPAAAPSAQQQEQHHHVIVPHLAVNLPPLRAPENVRGAQKWTGDEHTGPQGPAGVGKGEPDWNWLPEERREKALGGAWVGSSLHPHAMVAAQAPNRGSLPWVQADGTSAPLPDAYKPPGHFGRPAVQGVFGALAAVPSQVEGGK